MRNVLTAVVVALALGCANVCPAEEPSLSMRMLAQILEKNAGKSVTVYTPRREIRGQIKEVKGYVLVLEHGKTKRYVVMDAIESVDVEE